MSNRVTEMTEQKETKVERKPFNLEEELKKPYVVGIKKEYAFDQIK